jgi:F0F1-type ATP synthase assembly protein I
VALQGALVSTSAIAVALLLDGIQGLSLFSGGFSVVLPSLWFAWFLHRTPSSSQALAWLIGEFGKLGMAVVLLALLASNWSEMSWPAALAGLAVATMSLFFAPFLLAYQERRRNEQRLMSRLRDLS